MLKTTNEYFNTEFDSLYNYIKDYDSIYNF